MTNWSSFYGFATFLLDSYTGQPTDGPGVDYGTCVGHLGATYGWNSMVQFTPGINMSISVATNVESDEQASDPPPPPPPLPHVIFHLAL